MVITGLTRNQSFFCCITLPRNLSVLDEVWQLIAQAARYNFLP